MKWKINKKVEVWLESLGYSFDSSLYGPISRMCYSKPSYKVMADLVLESIKNQNRDINSNIAWEYTTNFVNGMKSNLIANNNYFQSVLHKGLFDPRSSKQTDEVILFSDNKIQKDKFNFLKKFHVKNANNEKIFDFLILINGFPIGLIRTLDSKQSSFIDEFYNLEKDFENFPMLFNFNKIIMLTDGRSSRIGTIYDFPEDYLHFEDMGCSSEYNHMFSNEGLSNLLKTDEIKKNLKMNKNIGGVSNFINQKVEYKKSTIDKNLVESQETISHINNPKDQKFVTEDSDLSFLSEFFTQDLEDVIDSSAFKKKLSESKEVADFKQNRLYIEDFKENRDEKTLETFVEANEGLVMKEANRFISYETPSMGFDDFYQLGYIGLLKALERFDLEKENEFSTYAIYWIRQTILRGIEYDSLTIRIPTHRWSDLSKLNKLEKISEVKFGVVNYEWISNELDLSEEKTLELVIIRNIFMNSVSLDTPVGIDEDTYLVDLISDEAKSVEDYIVEMDLKNMILNILNTLSSKEKDILIKRFGLNDIEPMTLEEIGQIYGVTRERIRQIEKRALNKISNSSRIRKIEEYCEG